MRPDPILVIVGRLLVGVLIDRFWAPGVASVFIVMPIIAMLLMKYGVPSMGTGIVIGIAIGLAAGAAAWQGYGMVLNGSIGLLILSIILYLSLGKYPDARRSPG